MSKKMIYYIVISVCLFVIAGLIYESLSYERRGQVISVNNKNNIGVSNTIYAYSVISSLSDMGYRNGYVLYVGDYSVYIENKEAADYILQKVFLYYENKIYDRYGDKFKFRKAYTDGSIKLENVHVEKKDIFSKEKAISDIINHMDSSDKGFFIIGENIYNKKYDIVDSLVFVNGRLVSEASISNKNLAETSNSTDEFLWPVNSKNITSLFGERWGAMHKGVDIGVQTGTNVWAAIGGRVLRAEYIGTYGICVIIESADGYETRYAHLSKTCVKQGDKVSRGQLIAKSGNTGRSTGPHLHFEIRKDGKAQDPLERNYK